MAHIRNFRLSDFSSVLDLWRLGGLTLRPGDDMAGIKLKLKRDRELFLVAEKDKRIVGTILGAWDGRRGWINHLVVHPGFQRLGIGKSLVDEVETRLARKGALKVNAQVHKWNRASFDFFEALGYEKYMDLVMIGKSLKRSRLPLPQARERNRRSP